MSFWAVVKLFEFDCNQTGSKTFGAKKKKIFLKKIIQEMRQTLTNANLQFCCQFYFIEKFLFEIFF